MSSNAPKAIDPQDTVQFLVGELKKVYDSKSMVGAIIMTYVLIDSMARAGLPAGRNDVKRDDFVAWVDKYMKTATPAEYQYAGIDVYNARCGMLHTFTAQIHKPARHFGYHDGSPHRYRPDIDARLVMISVPLFIDDFWVAVARFLADKHSGPDYAVVQSRFGEMFAAYPYKGKSWEPGGP